MRRPNGPLGLSLALVLLIALSLLPSLAAQDSGSRKIAPDLRDRLARAQGSEASRVIVLMHGLPVAGDKEKVRRLGGQAGKDLPLVAGFVATVPLSALEDVAADPRVRRITPDRKVRPSLDVAVPSAGAARLRGPAGLTGAGVGVAVIDSGVYPHEDLPGLAGFVDFVQANAPFGHDPLGHGTHVAGIIGARPRPGREMDVGGLAPGAALVSLRVLDRNGDGFVSDVIDAIHWALANRAAHGIRILNLSLGHPVQEPAAFDPLAEACERAWRAGLVVVASAGNIGLAGNGTVTSPGSDPLILTVGALDDRNTPEPADDGVAPYSSRGPTMFDLVVKPDLVAPGHRIISLRSPHSSLDVQHPEARVSLGGGSRGAALEPRHFEMSGTSMAAAVVSGTVALMLEADPTLTPDTVKARLMSASRRLGYGSIFDRGAGAADAEAAIERRGTAITAASAPVGGLGGDVVIEEPGVQWGDPALWTLEAIYGNPALWDEDLIAMNGFLDDPCVTGQGFIWQGLASEGFIWQGIASEAACTSPAGMIWQGGSVSRDGMVWQGGFIWQGFKGK